MAWYAPVNGDPAINDAFPGNGLFVGPDVTFRVSGARAVDFGGTACIADIHGTVIAMTAAGIVFGVSATAEGHDIMVHAGAFVRGFNGTGFAANGFGTNFVNAGDIFSSTSSGVAINSGNPGQPAATITNTGKIAGETNGVSNQGINTVVLINSGTVESDFRAYYSPADGIDKITNTGRMTGRIELFGNNDTYDGAAGRLTGTVFAGAGNDTVIGGADNDRFEGEDGNDALTGNGGKDILLGGVGLDRLTGGLGADTLTGGTGADRFIFKAAAESRGGTRDTIVDFSRGQGDRIQLTAIDANTKLAGNQAFTFIGTAGFSGKAGELRFQKIGTDTHIQADIDGNRTVDFLIVSDAPVSFVKGDFLL
jgi:Ca2+-binding RTX toxin-like protein